MNNHYKPGDRVGAVLSKNDERLRLIGFGVYEGEHVPDDPRLTNSKGESLMEKGIKNPRILLDSGKYVYGIECWWGEEAMIHMMIETAEKSGLIIENVDIDAHRESWMEMVKNIKSGI